MIARYLAFTGANGGKFFVLPIPAQNKGQAISTSTVVNDNTSAAVVLDFADQELLGGIGVDLPGNNLFAQTYLNLPRGVRWYSNRMYWIGEKNTVVGLLNMDMAGGSLSGSTLPAGWTTTGSLAIEQVGIMPALTGTGTISQGAFATADGAVLIQPKLNYSIRLWGTGTVIASLSSATTGFSSTANIIGSYQIADFSLAMPAVIPQDLVFTLQLSGATIRDVQLIYADNPNRNPVARASYVQNPEAFDSLTANAGPADDNSELRALAVLQESLYFITEKRLYSVQQIGNAEPSSWDPVQVSDKCGAFDANSVVTGKGWIAWGGPEGAFLYGGGLPDRTSAIITPTWKKYTGMSSMFNDSDAERVYFGMKSDDGNSMLVYDYHEVGLGGGGKWSPWNRPLNWVSDSSTGTTFAFESKTYQLSDTAGTADDDLGEIGGYYTLPPFGVSMFRKDYSYMGLRITGSGTLTPFVYGKTLTVAPQALSGQDLAALLDPVAEWDQNISHSRSLFVTLGQPGVQFSLEAATVIFNADPNGPVSGNR